MGTTTNEYLTMSPCIFLKCSVVYHLYVVNCDGIEESGGILVRYCMKLVYRLRLYKTRIHSMYSKITH